jgi:hypothetical protein
VSLPDIGLRVDQHPQRARSEDAQADAIERRLHPGVIEVNRWCGQQDRPRAERGEPARFHQSLPPGAGRDHREPCRHRRYGLPHEMIGMSLYRAVRCAPQDALIADGQGARRDRQSCG